MSDNYYKEQIDRIKLNQEALHKAIPNLTGVFFALIPFIFEKLNDKYESLKILVILSDGIALFCVLLSFYICMRANEEDLKMAENYYLKNAENKESFYTKMGRALNLLSLLSFLCTIIFLMILLVLSL